MAVSLHRFDETDQGEKKKKYLYLEQEPGIQ